jgi:hypothetical protein
MPAIMTTEPVKLAKTFLLIQDGVVLHKSATPSFLRFDRVNEDKNFQVAIGCLNELGKKEVVGTVANAIPKYASMSYRVSSAIDSDNRLVGCALPMTEIIRQRLSVYWRKGQFDDLCNLPQTVVVIGVQ